MKKIVSFVSVVCLLVVSSVCMAGEKVRLTNGEWPPYLSKSLKHYGVASHVVESAFNNVGITVEYGFYPWKRAYTLAQRGDWDGSVVWTPTDERKKDFYCSDPVASDVTVFFHLRSKPFDWKSFSDLKNLKIGATLSYDYGKPFAENEKSGAIKVDRAVKDETSFKKLLIKRIDIFVCNLDVGYSLIHKMYPIETASLFTNHPLPVKEAPLVLLLSNRLDKNKQLIDKFNKGLKQLKDSGKFDEYFDASRQGKYKK
jgi:polar amino acid transport system substrate-binding protein